MKSVLFIAPSAYPLGGVQTWLDAMLHGLGDRGWAPILGLVCGEWHKPEPYLQQHPWHHVVRIENTTGTRSGRIRALRKTIRRVRPNLTVGVNIADVYDAFVLSRMGRCFRIAMALHGIEPEWVGEVNRLSGCIDSVICTNQLTKYILERLSDIETERVYYAPCGVENAPSTQRTTVAAAPFRILFAARLEESQKRVFDLPCIVAQLSASGVPFELTIAGDGPDRAELERRLSVVSGAENVRMVGNVPREILLHSFLASADSFLVTSEWETGPITIWESMQYQIPVVTSRYLGSGRENSLRHNENCLMFDVGDTASAARELVKLVNTYPLRRRLVEGGLALVRSRYSVKASLDAWESAFEQTLSGPTRTHRRLPVHSIGSESRLARIVGEPLAELFRQALRRRHRHTEPGGEWPHIGSFPTTSISMKSLWKLESSMPR